MAVAAQKPLRASVIVGPTLTSGSRRFVVPFAADTVRKVRDEFRAQRSARTVRHWERVDRDGVGTAAARVVQDGNGARARDRARVPRCECVATTTTTAPICRSANTRPSNEPCARRHRRPPE